MTSLLVQFDTSTMLEKTVSTLDALTIESDGAGDAAISFLLTGGEQYTVGIDNSDGDKFKISDGAALGTNDRFVIDSSGNVGINRSSPGARIEIREQVDGNIAIFRRDGGTQNPGLETVASEASGYVGWDTIYSTTTPAYVWQFNGVEKMRVHTTGNVGIGTAGPATRAHVYDNDSGTGGQLTLEQDSTGDAALSFLITGGERFMIGIDNSDGDKFKISDGAALGSGDRIVIDSSGNVGFGTSAPVERIDTGQENIACKRLKIRNATNDVGEIYLDDNGEVFARDDASNSTQLTSHPDDAPPQCYGTKEYEQPGRLQISKQIRPYEGVIVWTPLAGPAASKQFVETFSEFQARRGLSDEEMVSNDLIARDREAESSEAANQYKRASEIWTQDTRRLISRQRKLPPHLRTERPNSKPEKKA